VSSYTPAVAIRFEWDEAKNRANKGKHGITFEQASEVFTDPNWLPRFDQTQDGENRWHAIGLVRGIWLILVVHTSAEDGVDQVIRIISARRANRKEERFYGEQNG
jgi:uncharacterized DUF497 family protein